MSTPHPAARFKRVAFLLGLAATVLVGPPASAQFDADDVIRLNRSNPIITANMFPSNRRGSDGSNINGPSMIRIPGWIPRSQRANRRANYYLYFGHHDGDYIRMAWSASPTGPFTLYRADAGVGTRGVMDNNNTHITLDENIQIRRNHIASPDVHVDNDNRQIIMYFHSGNPYRFNGRDISEQVSWVNTSSDGLNFRRRDTRSVQLGPSYFRVFEDNRTLYAFHNNGGPVRARSFDNPWEPTRGYYDGRELPPLWESRGRNMFRDAFTRDSGQRVRHSSIRVNNRNAQVFYSIRGHSPERLFVSNINLNTRSWDDWRSTIPGTEILRAVGGWEGGHLTPQPSVGGPAVGVNQLRDPYIFEDDDGSLYLFYSGQGEDAMGVAAVSSPRQRISAANATHDAETRGGTDGNRNFGSSEILSVRGSTGTNDRRSYLRYSAPGGGEIEAAVIRLYLPNNESGNLDIYAAANFDERTVTGNNRPDQIGRLLDRVPMGQRGFYEVDVTDYVNANRSRELRFVLRTNSGRNVEVVSSEGRGGRRPILRWMQRR